MLFSITLSDCLFPESCIVPERLKTKEKAEIIDMRVSALFTCVICYEILWVQVSVNTKNTHNTSRATRTVNQICECLRRYFYVQRHLAGITP